ncbi:PAS domain-containing protein [Bradyrhizobium diazoefficiens]|uniref:PAS domain-containing protein n=1 Tax=Bradyrhizobium diazoefficiens TaxID=1355477 RepID=UPI002B46AECE|nr:PAS domain S-box protein [Bradyrhizobium diazoefficiens]WRJ62520.1 PAS domain S-box protein [Bradyrhizobium diazoefficiens]
MAIKGEPGLQREALVSELALDRAERLANLLASIVESSDDVIVSKNLDGIITSWNKGAERIFGYSAAEAIGQPITLVIPEDRQSEEREILTRIRRGERLDHFETVRRRRDGSSIVVSLTVSPVKDAHGNIIGASKIARDITEHKRAQEQISHSGSRGGAPKQEHPRERTGNHQSFSVRHLRAPQGSDQRAHPSDGKCSLAVC